MNKDYVEYIAERLNENTDWQNYFSKQISESNDYVDYIAESLLDFSPSQKLMRDRARKLNKIINKI